MLVDQHLNVIRRIILSYKTSSPQPGWSEQNPEDWWRVVCQATAALVRDIDVSAIASISVTGQMMGCLPVAEDGEPLYPCIMWSDQRSAAQMQEIDRVIGLKRMHEITGQPASSGYTLPKILWLREHRPDVLAKTHVFLQTKDYINYCLTGCFATDQTDASYTLCFDVKEAAWSAEIIDALNLQREYFPEIRNSASILHYMQRSALVACGLPLTARIAVTVGAGDGSVAHAGGLCFNPGDAYVSLGSSAWYMQCVDSLTDDETGVLQCEPHILPQRFVMGGTMQTGGMSYDWLKKSLYDDLFDHGELEKRVAQSSPLSGGTMFFPFLQGERSPWVDAELRGAFYNLGLDTCPDDIVRAVLEGVMFNLLTVRKRCAESTGSQLILIGGGAANTVWCQMISDTFYLDVFVPEFYLDAGSIGSAILSLIALGDFPDLSAFKNSVHGRTYAPNPEHAALYAAAHKLWVSLAEQHFRMTELLSAYRRLAKL